MGSLTILLAAMPMVAGGCTGVGLGEGGGVNIGPAPPPNFNDPIYQGNLTGLVTFEPGFLHNWLLVQQGGGAPKGRSASAIDRDREFYQGLEVRIFGPRGRRTVKVSPEGGFEFGDVRAGDYDLEIIGPKGKLAGSSIALEGKSRMRVTVRVMGVDLADLDRDGDRHELVVEREIEYKSDAVQFRRILSPTGDVRTVLADGSVEYQGKDGYVKAFGADGAVDYRFDPQNRFVDEEKDHETGSRKKGRAIKQLKPPADPLMAKATGRGRCPLVLSVAVRGAGDGRGPESLAVGELALLEVRTDANGGVPLDWVVATIHSHHGPVQSIPLLDDGGVKDTRPGWTGVQSSLDRQKGDGIFTLPLPLDLGVYRLLSGCQIVVTATNENRLSSRPTSMHLYLPSAPSGEARPSRLAAGVRSVRVVRRPGPGATTFHAEIGLKEAVARPLSGSLIGPAGFKRLLTAAGATTLVSTPAPVQTPGCYTILLSDPAGDVYYATLVVGSRPTGGSDDAPAEE